MTVRVAAAATSSPVTLDQAKARLNILHNDDNTVVTGLIKTATAEVEAATQRRFITQTLEWVLPCWPARCFRLPVATNVRDDFSIAFQAENGEVITMDAADFVVSPSGETLSVRPVSGLSWPILHRDAVEPIVISFKAGSNVAPEEAQTAILFMVEYLYAPSPDWKLTASGLPECVETLVSIMRWE
jgi:uncharacterized phiE125 gp8 family phage protein